LKSNQREGIPVSLPATESNCTNQSANFVSHPAVSNRYNLIYPWAGETESLPGTESKLTVNPQILLSIPLPPPFPESYLPFNQSVNLKDKRQNLCLPINRVKIRTQIKKYPPVLSIYQSICLFFNVPPTESCMHRAGFSKTRSHPPLQILLKPTTKNAGSPPAWCMTACWVVLCALTVHRGYKIIKVL
jgi:hypothetical protein